MSTKNKIILSVAVALLGIFLIFSADGGKSLDGFHGIWEESPRLSYLFTISGLLVGSLGIFWTHNIYESRFKTGSLIALIAFVVLFMYACGGNNGMTKLMDYLLASKTPGFLGFLQSRIMVLYIFMITYLIMHSIVYLFSDGILGKGLSRTLKIECIIGTVALLWTVKPTLSATFSGLGDIVSSIWWIIPIGVVVLMVIGFFCDGGKKSSSSGGGGGGSVPNHDRHIPHTANVTFHAAGSYDIIDVEGIGTLIELNYYWKHTRYYNVHQIDKSKLYTYRAKNYYRIRHPSEL